MVDRPCRGRLDLFPSTKVNNMLKYTQSIDNNDIVLFLHVLTRSQRTRSFQQIRNKYSRNLVNNGYKYTLKQLIVIDNLNCIY